MEINLILAAQGWQLAAQLERTNPAGGILLIKNIPERTYLAVTPEQWEVLVRFKQTQRVPQVLEGIIADRICPALGEFYELILKAVRARILVVPGHSTASVPALNWSLALKPAWLRLGLWLLFVAGLGFTVALRPARPESVGDYAAGLLALAGAGAAGVALSASLLRGAGGEVYSGRHRWQLQLSDACMLATADQRLVMLAVPALVAAVTGFLAWRHAEWSSIPLLGLLVLLRPVLHGRVSRMIRVGADRRLSDAEQEFIFPPNRTPRVRWRLLRDGLRSPVTWLEVAYGVIWTLALGFCVGVVTEMAPWSLAFWSTQGPRLAVAIIGSLGLLGVGYAGSEFYLWARERAIARRETMRQWYQRWFGRAGLATDETSRLRAVLRSPLLRLLPPPTQQVVAKALRPEAVGCWKTLHDFGAPIAQVSLILSGKVGIYRRLNSGRRALVQVLCEDDLVGLHAVADPQRPVFLYRTLTPVLLLRLDWARAEELLLARFGPPVLANLVQKLPFLSRISLCQNWHMQAITRFAELARITDYKEDEVIIQTGFFSDSFFIIFEGAAHIVRGGRRQAVLHGSEFFGEIGLLQSSNATAQVIARAATRCLCIPRREFLRFVAHNYTVALELERVSSARLGRPVFPLSKGSFETH